MSRTLKRLNGISLSIIVLALLKQEDSYGQELYIKIKKIIQGEIKWSKASVYPILKELEKERMIRSFWKIEDKVRPRKYYSILDKGIAQLEARKEEADFLETEFRRILNPYIIFPGAEDDMQSFIDTDRG